MGLTRIAEYCSKYAKAYGKNVTKIIETRPAVKTELAGLKYTPLAEDAVKLSECLRVPTQEKLETILKEQGLYKNLLCVEEPFIKDNNSLFIEELVRRFPLKAGEKENLRVHELMLYLEDINHSGYPNKKEFLEKFLQDVKEVESLLDRDGKQMFSGMNLWSMLTRRTVLQAKYNNPERYQEIMDLYKLHMEGKVSKYVLKRLFPDAHFHKLPKSDMQKLLRGENYYPKLAELSEEAISKLEIGEAFSVGKEMFVKTVNGYEKLKMDSEMYEKLFPAIERYALAQGDIGNCHLMAAMDSILKNPEGRIEFYKLFEQVGKNKVKCTLHDPDYKKLAIIYDLDDLSMIKEVDCKGGSLGHTLIEYTYAKNMYDYAMQKDSVSYFIKNALAERTYGGLELRRINGEGGDAETVSDHIKRLIGWRTETKYECNDSTIQEVLKEQKGISVANCTTRIPNKGIEKSHFYNSGDLRNGTLVNPWNTMEEIPYNPFDLQKDITYVV